MNEAKDQACPYKEAVEMIVKICRSNKHKHPVSDIECECNRAIINAARAGGREPEAVQNAGDIAGSSSATLLAAFDDALIQNPFLWIEIGYTRPTDWMVHVWDRTRKIDDGKIFSTQSTNRDEACHEATQKLRDYLARGSS